MCEVIWKGTFNVTGYGKWSRKCCMALLSSEKYKLKADLLGYRFTNEDPLFNARETKLKNPITVFNTIPTNPVYGNRAGYCTCTELKVPPKIQIKNMNDSKFVLALSNFSTENFKAVLDEPEKVFKVNYPIFKGEYSPYGKRLKLSNLSQYKFKFLFVGRIDVRKNIATLIKAFKEEFGSNRDVCLILKIYSPDYNIPMWINQNKPTDNIFWLRERISDISVLYRSVDAYITTDIGEAWGGPTQEAMLCGIPAIAPRHSGHLDYMNKYNSFQIEVEKDWRVIGHRDNNIYENLLPADGLVKYPIFEDIKNQMRDCYINFRKLTREERLEVPMIKNALKTQSLVSKKTIFNQLDTAFKWIEENVK